MTMFEQSAMFWALNNANPITGNPVSLLVAGALLREAKRHGLHAEVVAWLRKERRDHLVALTLRQRRWQRETRRAGRARHHDSVAIRERYVRINNH